MKKSLISFAIMGGLVAAAALTGCNSGEDNIIHLELVPSNDPATLLTRAKALAPILQKYAPNYEWTITVGDTYASTTTALTAGQIDGGFLTASGYAQETIENPGKVEVLLSASRAGYKVQADDFKGFDAAAKEKQRKAMNGMVDAKGNDLTKDKYGSADAYQYFGDQSSTEVMYYSGIILALKDSARTALGLKALDDNADGDTSLSELHAHEAVVGIMGATSGAGYIYPTKAIYDAGYSKGFVDKTTYSGLSADDKAKAFIGFNQTSYPNAVDMLMTGKVDAVCGFMDIRYGSAYVQDKGTYQNDKTLFTKSMCVAITDPIMNDTVSVYSGLSTKKKEAIKTAFKAAVKDGDKNTEGTGAYLLYQIYSHTGYVDATDSDYESARTMYKWTLDHAS
jgi:phosphonate transport system substrate-binding protein